MEPRAESNCVVCGKPEAITFPESAFEGLGLEQHLCISCHKWGIENLKPVLFYAIKGVE